MTTPHSLILSELQKYRDGKFVPTYSPTATNYRLELTKEGWFYQTESGQRLGGRNGTVYAADAHVHIELAAIKMLHRAGEVWMPKSLTPEALLAAVRGINEKENA